MILVRLKVSLGSKYPHLGLMGLTYMTKVLLGFKYPNLGNVELTKVPPDGPRGVDIHEEGAAKVQVPHGL